MLILTKSKTRRGLFAALFGQPRRSYYLSELAREVKTSPGNVQRELRGLLKDQWVVRERKGRMIFYRANSKHALFPEVASIVRKTSGIEAVLRSYFETRPEVQLAYLFGSQATGKANRLSDVDVAVLTEPSRVKKNLPYGYKAEIGTDLMSLLKTNRVDIVLLNEAPPFLRHQVLKTGKCLWARDPSMRIQFETEALARFLDVKPLLQSHYESKEAA